ncbi:unnamed protein product [Prorocentrum cordatum]|uniref:RanBP2-type domain-containing protein n=1 Tax=Prorocentrum cordatum TaxID=2364126 RepID=A0ABN9R365_9DINO|nr:unnamed protein product [Polarella glacialis]
MSGDCSNPAGEGVRKRPRCPVPGCKEKLTETTSIVCTACGSRTCMRHRYEDAHPCARAQPSRAKPGAGEWQCQRCTLVNARGSSECLACGAASGAAVQRPRPPAAPGAGWTCGACTLQNGAASTACAACGAARALPGARAAPPWRWRCAACTLENAPGSPACAVCGASAESVAVRIEGAGAEGGAASRGCGVS